MKNLFWRVGRLWCVGLGLLLLRLSQNMNGFDANTGLAVRSLPGTAAPVILALCALGELALFFKNSKVKTQFSAQFAPPDQELLAVVLGSLLLAAGGVLFALQGFRQGMAAAGVAGVLALAAGGGFLFLNRKARAGDELTVVPMLAPMLFTVFFVLSVYMPAEDDPVFARYYLPVLAASVTACSFSLLAGFLQKESSPRSFIFAGDMTVILCLMAAADGDLARVLLFAGCALVMSVYLLLCRDEVSDGV